MTEGPERSNCWVRRSALGLTSLSLLALASRYALADSVRGLDVLFYAMPLPVIGMLLLVAGPLWLRSGSRRGLIVCLGCAAALIGLSLVKDHVRAPCEIDRPALRVTLWNVARGDAGWESIAEELADDPADVIGLVEAYLDREHGPEFWREHLPRHRMVRLRGGLLLFTRGEVQDFRALVFGIRSRWGLVDLLLDGRPLRVVMVDLEANPLSQRIPLLREITAVAAEGRDSPRIVMGDFNTPTDSTGYAELREEFREAFESAGTGFRATWPRHLPMFVLDQIWVSQGVEIDCTTKRFSKLSDHARLDTRLQVYDRSDQGQAIRPSTETASPPGMERWTTSSR